MGDWANQAQKQPIGAELRGLGMVIAQPSRLDICCLDAVTYAAFMALQGLWIGPLPTEHYGFTRIEVGNVALSISIAVILGRIFSDASEPGPSERRKIIIWFSVVSAAQFKLFPTSIGIRGIAWRGDLVTAILEGYRTDLSLIACDFKSGDMNPCSGRALDLCRNRGRDW